MLKSRMATSCACSPRSLPDNRMRISEADLREDRFSRLRLIPCWEQSKIANCRLLVVGAGALGNEILKSAALLGLRKVIIVDLDRIEESNLFCTFPFSDTD